MCKAEKNRMELIDSKYTREKLTELGVEFDEWQKAVILWHKPLLYQEMINALSDFVGEVSDLELKQQIEQRISIEKKMLEKFKENLDDEYVYVVKLLPDECDYGILSAYDIALIQAQKVRSEEKERVKIEKHRVIREIKESDFLDSQVATVIFNAEGQIETIWYDEITEAIDISNTNRFERKYFEVPYVHEPGMLVKYGDSDEYAVVATSKAGDDRAKELMKKCDNLEFYDNNLVVYQLTDEGYWSHEHWSPFLIDKLEVSAEATDKRSLEYWSAMEALSDYLTGNTSPSQEELVIRTARAYAESERKLSGVGRIASEGTKVQDILW